MTTDWKAFGAWVRAARGARSRQIIVDRAKIADDGNGFSVSWLQTLEDGGRTSKGDWVDPSPEDRKLIALARALDVPTAELFDRLERPTPEWLTAEEARAVRLIASAGLGVGAPVSPDVHLEKRVQSLESRVAEIERLVALGDLVTLERDLRPVRAADNPADRQQAPAEKTRTKATRIARRKGSQGDPV